MRKKIYNFIALSAVLFCMGFLTNFLWEGLHGVYLYRDHNMPAVQYVPMLVYVSIMDGLLIVGLYLWTSLWHVDLFWPSKTGGKPFLLFVISALSLAVYIEYRAVYMLEKWSYLPEMPTLFGIGISPLIQLAVTGAVAVATVRCTRHCWNHL